MRKKNPCELQVPLGLEGHLVEARMEKLKTEAHWLVHREKKKCVYGHHESSGYCLSTFTVNPQISLRGFNYGYRMGCKKNMNMTVQKYIDICREREKMS